MRLIFKGKILKDEMTLDEYKITDGLTVHVVKGKSANAPPTAAVSTSSTGAEASSLGGGVAAAGDANPAAANPFAAMGMGGAGGMPGGFNPAMM
jgi:ubiquilin